MEFNGKSTNGLNQTSIKSVSLFVSGSPILNASSESVSIVGDFTASAVQTYEINSFGSSPIVIGGDVQLSGSLNISSSISASLYKGDGSGLFNILASSLGDLDQIKSGSAVANISPNKGLVVNVPTSISGGLAVNGNVNITGSAVIKQNLTVNGRIQTTEFFAQYISSSII